MRANHKISSQLPEMFEICLKEEKYSTSETLLKAIILAGHSGE
jgi:hypothetical protein